jgi:hypothetical protein
MTCAELRERVWLAADEEELSEEERRELELHLAVCAECRGKARESRRIAAALRRLEAPASPPGFKESTLARLEERPIRRVPIAARWLAAAAAVLALIGLLRSFGVRQPSAPESEIATLRPVEKDASAERAQPGALTQAPQAEGAKQEAAADDVAKSIVGGQQDAPSSPPAGEPERPRDGKKPALGAPAGAERPAETARRLEAAGDEAALDRVESGVQPAQPGLRADSPAAALELLLQRTAPEREAKSELREEDALLKRKSAKPARGAAPAASREGEAAGRLQFEQSVPVARSEFLVAPADAPALAEWLRSRPHAAAEGIVVADVMQEDVASLLRALEAARELVEPVSEQAWIERVATARRTGLVSKSKELAATAEPARSAAPPPPAGNRPVAPPEPPADSREREKAASDRGEPPRLVRLVLWLEPRAAGKGGPSPAKRER